MTVEIGGNTTQLSKALSSANKVIKTTQTGLKEVNKLLKLDPKNTELLKEKQSLLEKQINKTKDKLQALNQAQEKLAQMLEKGDIDQGTYDNITKKIDKPKEELSALEKQAEETASALKTTLSDFGNKMQGVGEKIENVGKALMPLSAAAAGVATAGIKAASDWESAFAGVRKTVDATEEQYEELASGIRKMATETASSAEDIAAVAEAAGQLGVKTDDVLDFTKTMVMLGDSTNVSADEAAKSLAQFLNIVNGGDMSGVDRLGAAIVELGNNFATDEASIIAMSQRLASAGKLAGLTETDILGLATAMSSVGIQAEAGGTAMTQTLTAIEKAVSSAAEGSTEDLEQIARIAGTSAEDFAKAWEDNPIVAIQEFITGLGQLDEQGESATQVLEDLGMSGIRQSNMLKSLALASDTLTRAVDVSSSAYKENTALTNEASKRYETFASKLNQTKERAKQVASDIGESLIPLLEKLMDVVEDVTEWWKSLDDSTKDTIATTIALTAALAPVIIGLGKVVSIVGTILTYINPFTVAIGAIAAAMIYLGATATDAYAEARELNEREAETAGTVDGLAESYSALAEARDAATKTAEDEANKETYLWQELQKVVDADGNVLKGQEARAQYLTGELAEALGVEIDLTKGQIENYDELSASLDKVIERKKAQAILSANEAAYAEAISNQAQAYSSMKEAAAQVAMEEGRLADAEKTLNDLTKERDAAVEEATKSAINATQARMAEERITASYEGAIRQASDAVQGHKDRLDELNGTLTTAEETYAGYSSTIQNYEDLSAALITEDEAAISDAVLKTAGNFRTATTANKAQLTAQRDDLKKKYEEMQAAVNSGAPGITQKQVDEAKRMYELSEAELKKLPPEYSTAAKESAQSLKNSAQAQRPGVQSSLRSMVDMGDTVSKARTWGSDFMSNLISGMNSKKPVLSQTVNGIANLYKKTLGHSVPETGPMKDELTWMPDMMMNLAKGIDENKWRVLNEAQGLAADLKKTLTVQLQGGNMTADINNRTTIELDGRVVADVVNKNLGVLV